MPRAALIRNTPNCVDGLAQRGRRLKNHRYALQSPEHCRPRPGWSRVNCLVRLDRVITCLYEVTRRTRDGGLRVRPHIADRGPGWHVSPEVEPCAWDIVVVQPESHQQHAEEHVLIGRRFEVRQPASGLCRGVVLTRLCVLPDRTPLPSTQVLSGSSWSGRSAHHRMTLSCQPVMLELSYARTVPNTGGCPRVHRRSNSSSGDCSPT